MRASKRLRPNAPANNLRAPAHGLLRAESLAHFTTALRRHLSFPHGARCRRPQWRALELRLSDTTCA